MCARYVLLPNGEKKWLPSKCKVYSEKDSFKYQLNQQEMLKGLLSDQFEIASWQEDPFFGYHICPTDNGIIIIEKNGQRIAFNSKFSFQRKWKTKDGKARSFTGNNFRTDNLLPKKYEAEGFLTNKSVRGNWMYYPAFKNAQTCLVIAWGFIEFVKVNGKSIGYYTELKTGEPFLASGLYEEVEGTFYHTIGTVEPNEQMERIKHDRLISIILQKEKQQRWLSTELSPLEKMSVFESVPANIMQSWKLGPKINNSRNKGPEVLDRVGEIISVAA